MDNSRRLASLDAFRGLTMILMVLVNTAGSSAVYTQLEHSPWHGLTLADVIFPSFVWIVGITTTMSSRTKAVGPILLRSLKMFLLGLCVYIAPGFSFTTQRITGVLQRIAICYLVGSLLYLYTSRRVQVICIVVLLGGYWALMAAGGDFSIEGNLAHAVDHAVLGMHNYHNTKTWDPEGILSTLPAIATMLLGMMAGYELRREAGMEEKLKRLAIAGVLLLAAGLLVNIWFPINKKLWTSSFVLVCAGIDCLVLPAFVYWIDMKGRARLAKPLIVMGMNAIAVYMLSELLDEALSMAGWKRVIFRTCFQPLASPPMASFLYAAAFTLLMYAAAYVLYRRKLFLRL